MILYQALRYPFQGKNWFRRISVLALIQLLPIVGQMILFGYGLEVVRALYARQTDLPPLKWLQALQDGFRFLLAGILYSVPIIQAVLGVAAIVAVIESLTPIRNSGPLTLFLTIFLSLLLFLVIIGLYIGGVRYAIEKKGLFAPNSSVKILLKNRSTSGILLMNFLLLNVLAILAISLGALLLILPGLFAFVTYSLASWYLFAYYGMQVTINKNNVTHEQKKPDIKASLVFKK